MTKFIDDSTEPVSEPVKEEAVPLKFSAYTKSANTKEKVVRLVMDLDLDMHASMDILKALKDAEVNVEFPEGIVLKDVTLRSVEIRKQ